VASVALFWLVMVTMVRVGSVPIVDAILVVILLVGVPGLSLAQVPLVHGARIERLPAYWGSIVTLWLLGTVCWLVGTREGGAAAIGVVGLPIGVAVVWTVVLLLGGLAIIVVFRQIALWARIPETPLLRSLLPQTPKERYVFVLLSVAAGTGEEVAYRGYAIPVLASLLGIPGAAVLTTLVFGALHAYQGWLGVVRTSLMGGVLAWGFLASGSLWPPIIAHTLIDVLAGVVFGERLMSPQVATGVPTVEHPTPREG
jgi:membrane protease YdiL (CAAX protease family)